VTNIFSFNLDFGNKQEKPYFASFPFIFDGKPVREFFCAVSSRFAGDMKIGEQEQNRRALFEELGLKPENVFGLKQIHSRNVLAVDGNNPLPAGTEGDGMITNDPNIALSVTVADCLPVFLLDAKTKAAKGAATGAFSLVHSGWKGTGIAAVALNLMKERYGSDIADIAAVLGPCIGPCCYKVDEVRAREFEKEFGSESVRKAAGEFFLDLKAANIKLLENAGVKNIAVCENCTFCDERLGSFRREGKGFVHMAAVVGRKLCQSPF
jgi:YfiH family protein